MSLDDFFNELTSFLFHRHRFFGRLSKPKTKLECEGYVSIYKDNEEVITEDVATNTTYYKYLKLMAKYMYKKMDMSWSIEVESKFIDVFIPFLRFSNRIEKVLINFLAQSQKYILKIFILKAIL